MVSNEFVHASIHASLLANVAEDGREAVMAGVPHDRVGRLMRRRYVDLCLMLGIQPLNEIDFGSVRKRLDDLRGSQRPRTTGRWHRGEEHETMVSIWEEGGGEVCRINFQFDGQKDRADRAIDQMIAAHNLSRTIEGEV